MLITAFEFAFGPVIWHVIPSTWRHFNLKLKLTHIKWWSSSSTIWIHINLFKMLFPEWPSGAKNALKIVKLILEDSSMNISWFLQPLLHLVWFCWHHISILIMFNYNIMIHLASVVQLSFKHSELIMRTESVKYSLGRRWVELRQNPEIHSALLSQLSVVVVVFK